MESPKSTIFLRSHESLDLCWRNQLPLKMLRRKRLLCFSHHRLSTCLTAQAYNEGMNTLPHEKRCAVIRCLVDGCSIRATTRITGVAKNTIQKLTRELGEAVLAYHDNVVRNVKSQRVQFREVQDRQYVDVDRD